MQSNYWFVTFELRISHLAIAFMPILVVDNCNVFNESENVFPFIYSLYANPTYGKQYPYKYQILQQKHVVCRRIIWNALFNAFVNEFDPKLFVPFYLGQH